MQFSQQCTGETMYLWWMSPKLYCNEKVYFCLYNNDSVSRDTSVPTKWTPNRFECSIKRVVLREIKKRWQRFWNIILYTSIEENMEERRMSLGPCSIILCNSCVPINAGNVFIRICQTVSTTFGNRIMCLLNWNRTLLRAFQPCSK